MPHTFKAQKNSQAVEFQKFFKPVNNAMIDMPKLESQGNRPLQMTFEDHLKALVYFHLEEHHSAQHLLQVLEQDDFARNQIAPEDGIKKRFGVDGVWSCLVQNSSEKPSAEHYFILSKTKSNISLNSKTLINLCKPFVFLMICVWIRILTKRLVIFCMMNLKQKQSRRL